MSTTTETVAVDTRHEVATRRASAGQPSAVTASAVATRTGHAYEAEFTEVIVHCECNEDFVERRYRHVASARFTARGDGTAAKIAWDIAPPPPDRGHSTVRVFRVVAGVRSRTDIQQDRIERARRFGGRRW